MSATLAEPVRVSLEEFFADPRYELFEWVDGEAVEVNLGKKIHGEIIGRIIRLLGSYLDTRPLGTLSTHFWCRTTRGRIRLPDVGIVLHGHPEEDDVPIGSPELVVEVRSPNDTLRSMHRKMDEYFASGARIGWIVLPEERTVLVRTGAESIRSLGPEDTLDGGDVLPGLQIPVARIFE